MSMNSKEIEERVVSMRFDNEQFEKGTKQTINTLAKLKQSLDFTGAVKGFKNIASETNIVKKNVDVLSSGVTSIKNEFDSLQVVGATALVRLTNAAINAGKRITNALTLDPVRTGFSEYEEKMGSIQTILTNTASKGTTLDEVVKTLDELNTYADKTIYNFAQMTKNIGTFTAAGLDLETSANSIQGIANLAAASGSTSQQASTAMYQLSQALSAGSLKLQDWNSVVNAGMGGQLFQNALKETAREFGVDVDAIIEKEGSFRESLSEGWITADILSTTLRKFTRTGAKEYAKAMQDNGKYTEEQTKKLEEQALMMENAATEVKTLTQLWDTLKETAQSGWGKTWEIIVGDYEQAKKTFTELNNIISPMIEKFSDSINNLLAGALGSQSKWTQIIDKFQSAGVSMENIKKGLAQSFINRGMAKDMEDFDYILNEVYGDWDTLWKSSEFGNNTTAIREGLLRAIKMTEGFSETTMSAAEKIEHFKKVVDKVWAGDYGNQDWNKERQKALEAEGYQYEHIQELVNKTTEAKTGMALADADISKEMLISIGLTKEEAEAFKALGDEMHRAVVDPNAEMNELIDSLNRLDGRVVLFKALTNSVTALQTALGAIAQGIKESFPDFASKNVYDLIVAFEKFTRSLILNEKQISIVKDTVRIFINLLDTAKYVLGTGLRLALKVIQTFLEGLGLDVAGFVEKLADGTQTLRDFVKQQDMVAVIMEKIGPYIRSFGEWVGNVIDKIKNGENIFAGFGDKIYNIIANLASKCPPLINNAIMRVLNFFRKNVTRDMNPENISKNFDSSVNSILNKLKEIKESDLSIGEITVDIFSKIKLGDSELTERFKEKVLPKLKAAFEWIVKMIKKIGTTAIQWLSKNFDPGAAIAGVMIYSMLKLAKDFLTVLDSFASPLESAQEMIESIGGMFNAIKKRINASTKNLKVQNFLIISSAIFMLAMAVRQLATIKQSDVWSAVGAMAALTLAMGLMAIVFSAVNSAAANSEEEEEDAKEVTNHFGLLGGMAVMILALAKALKDVSEIDSDALKDGLYALLLAIGVFIITIYAVTEVVKRIEGLDFGDIGVMFMSFGIAMVLLVNAVKMAGALDRGTLKRGIMFATGATLMMRILAASLRDSRGTFTGGAGVGASLILASIAIGLLVKVMRAASDITNKEIIQALKVLGAAEGLMLGFVLLTNMGKLFGSGSAKSLLTMTVAMSLIPLIIKQINKVTPKEAAYGLAVIGVIMTMFGLFSIATRIVGDNALKLGPTLLAMSLAIGLLVGTIALLGLMKMKTVIQGGLIVGALIGFISVLVLATKDCQDATRTLTALGVAVTMLAGIVVALTFVDQKKAWSAVGIIGVILASMAVMVASTKSLVGVKIGPLLLVIAGMILIIIAASVLAATISDSMSKDPKSTIAGIVATASLVVAACIGAYYMSKAGAFAKHATGKSLVQAGAIVLGLLGVCFVLSKVIGYFGGVDTAGILKAAPGIIMAGILTAICVAAAVFIMKQLNGVNVKWKALGEVGAIVLGLIAVMGIVSLLLAGITNSPIKTNGEAWVKLAMVALMTAFICGIAVFLGKILTVVSTSTKKLGVLAASMGLVAAALLISAGIINILDAGMANVKMDGQLLATLGIVALFAMVMLTCGALLATFVKTVAITKAQLTKLTIIMGLVAGLMLVAAGIAILVANFVMPALDGIKSPDTILTKVGALCAVLLAIAFVAFLTAAISKMVDIKKVASLGIAVVLVGLVAVIAGIVSGTVMKALSEVPNADGLIEKAISLGIVLVALGVVAAICALIGKVVSFDGALAGGLLLAEIAAVIELAIIAFEKFVGPGLPKLGEQIAQFGDGIKKFADNISGINTEAVEAVKCIVEIMGELSALEFKMGWMNKFHSDWVDDIKGDLVKLAECCCAFSDAITVNGGIDANAVNLAKIVVDTYATLADNLPKKGGWKEKLTGVKDFSAFSEDLKAFASAMLEFCKTLKSTEETGVDKQAVLDFCAMARPIINLQKQLYGTDGLWQHIWGEKDMSVFGEQSVKFAQSMIDFHAKISETPEAWKSEIWTNFAEAAKQVTAIGSTIENSGGLVGFLVGENDMDKFGNGLDDFAVGMKALYDNCGSIDWNTATWTNMRDCMAILGPMIKDYVPRTGGWLDNIKGQQDLDKFGTNLASFGSGIASFAKSIGEDTSSFRTGIAKRCTEDLKAVIEAMPSTNDFGKLKRTTNYIKNNQIGDSIDILGNIITRWSNSVATVNPTNMTTASSSLKLLVDSLDNASNIDFENIDNFGGSLQQIGANTMQGFVDAFENCYGEVAQAISHFSDEADEAYRYNGKSRMILFGKHMVLNIIDGIKDKDDEIKSAVRKMCDAIYDTIRDYRDHIFNIGQYLINGFISGINFKYNEVQEAVDNITNFIGPRMKNNLKERSPSKMTFEIGSYLGEGLANGMMSTASIIQNASDDISETATMSLRDALHNAITNFDDENLSPTITPVIDMSEVNNGFNDISSRLSNYTIGLRGSVPTLGYEMTNADIVDAIGGLGDNLGTTTNNYNINGITYDDGSNIASAVGQLIYAANVARRS
ncbi:MAG: tape measure protein [Pseudobutyrivibrio sp.]|nr:tape measure protein [Pseudobutyrivibrio sp.]